MSEKTSLREIVEASKQQTSVSTGENPNDYGYAPPVNSVTLPSKGKVYGADSPLFQQEQLDVRAMTAKDEDILSSRALIKKGVVLSTLMKSCITNKMIDPDMMLVGDRNAILTSIRVSAYGPEYPVEISCPQCDSKFENTFDLSTLPLKTLDVDPVAPGANVFKFLLPVTKREVLFKFMTGHDVAELDKTQERMRKVRGVGALEENVTTRLHAQCISIGGETDRNKLSQLIRNMPARDSKAWRDYIDEIAPGVEMLQNAVCPTCNEESEVDVPIGPEFFWPSK